MDNVKHLGAERFKRGLDVIVKAFIKDGASKEEAWALAVAMTAGAFAENLEYELAIANNARTIVKKLSESLSTDYIDNIIRLLKAEKRADK